MISNFKFLESEYAVLYQVGSTAEKYLYSDTNSCLIKLGMFGETIVNLMLKLDHIEPPAYDNTHANRIKLLKKEGMLPKEIDDVLFLLRKNRNQAIHANYDDREKCKTLLQMCFHLGRWFQEVYGTVQTQVPTFSMPAEENMDYTLLLQAQEEKVSSLLAEIEQVKAQNVSTRQRGEKSRSAVVNLNLSEKETRYIIDGQLRKVGWEADTVNLRYAKGVRPIKGRNIAIAEWPTDATSHNRGYVDYALFVDTTLVGMIEAKKQTIDIPAVIDMQCKDYASNVKEADIKYTIAQWGKYRVPFVFATNGRRYLKQLETKSGIWSLDLREKTNQAKAMQGWVSPENLIELLSKDVQKANETLKNTSLDILKDSDGLNLRDYQINAIVAAERAVTDGAQTALLSMATGTGKTRTILGMLYRFLKSGRCNRVLFLVDRSALGEQAQDVFKEVKLEDLMTLDNIYNIKTLEDKEIERETKIHVATVQSLVKRVLYNESDKIPAVSDYDLIIIDEAHRGYTLDRELDDDELLYRNEMDFLSKYRTVIEYFDAIKIALTATPALHTTEIFGKPVFTYSYREAVVEGYLVDHDAPHNLKTQLMEDGIQYKKGETMAIYNPVTGEIENSAELEDDVGFDVDQFNRKVITATTNFSVLKEISEDINPEGEAKTLIYAANDTHADLIVRLLREIYEPLGIDQDAIQKITGKTGDKKRVLDAIKHFKNEKYPNIVVTVDLLTTGIDVPEITTLIFMRRVKSRILFEQMLGRATRLCPEIGKSHFQIYDPAGVYESLEDVSTMKPVVANTAATLSDLLAGLSVLTDPTRVKNQIDLIAAKLRRKERTMSAEQKEYFKSNADGKTPSQFMDEMKLLSEEDAKVAILAKTALFEALNQSGNSLKRGVVISDKADVLVSHTRGYGNGQKPEDYLEEFAKFIAENIDKIEALKIVCTKPTSLTRESLKKLRLELSRHDFNETQLNGAWKAAKNEDIVADIISFIRAQAVGATLLGHDERIQKAIVKLKKAHNFTKMELDWLANIEKNLLTETVLSAEIFDTGAFRDRGGFARINKIFKNKLNDYIIELNQYLYDDGGNAA